jgi:DNA-directed RNA polymerase specialized sigma24 family protein
MGHRRQYASEFEVYRQERLQEEQDEHGKRCKQERRADTVYTVQVACDGSTCWPFQRSHTSTAWRQSEAMHYFRCRESAGGALAESVTVPSLRQLTRTLPPRSRQIIRQRFELGWSISSIAQDQKLSRSRIYEILEQAYAKISEKLPSEFVMKFKR